jgi:multiple sugar transport system permease protein
MTATTEITRGVWKRLVDNETFAGYVFALPFIIGFFSFTIIPMIISVYISFTDYTITSAPVWRGLANYARMFTGDPRFWKSISVTLYYVFVSVPLKVGFALVIAFILTRNNRFVGFYRSMYYLPSLIGGSIAVTLVWKELWAERGVINKIIQLLGAREPIFWLGDPSVAIWVLILLTVWQFGSSMIIFAAGLKQIPASYYEAASMDGASSVTQFFSITLPALSPVILFNFVMQTISGFMAFTQTFIISSGYGGPSDSTLFYALYIYNHAFRYQQMGYASAMAWIMLVLVGGVTAVIFKVSNAFVYYESKG